MCYTFILSHLIHINLMVLIIFGPKRSEENGGPQGCEMSRLPHFLENQFTDGGKVVSLTLRPPQGHSAAGRIR
jgi:hypothetical protein